MTEDGFVRVAAGHYLHVETGIKILRQSARREHGYSVGVRWHLWAPGPVGSRWVGSARSLTSAKAWILGGPNFVQVMRKGIANDHVDACPSGK